ncbi:hypothetical protein BDQ17DRAFT_1412053 [Cyathus striatus]|nr:hypothetical protein BDQ17DRAFT_1412053 [Cyathus striatus]
MSAVNAGLDISSIVLTTLQEAARHGPVPCLREAASLALLILDMIITTKRNKKKFCEIARDVCELVCIVIEALKPIQVTGEQTHEDSVLLHNVRQLVDTLTSIETFSKIDAARNTLLRFIRHRSDLKKIEDYKRQLQRCLDIFGLQSDISIRENLSRIIQNQEEAREERNIEVAHSNVTYNFYVIYFS